MENDIKTKKIIPIFYAVDDNYAALLHVSIESVISQVSKDYECHIIILCSNLSEENQKLFTDCTRDNCKIFICPMDKHIASYTDKMCLRDYYTNTTYFRVFIAEIFTQYDKALYLDTDTVLNADISELYNFDIGENYVGGITCETVDTTPVFTNYVEKFLGLKLPIYFNAGVMLMNLKKLREVYFKDRFFDIASKIKFRVVQDQDYFNVLCQGKVQFLPEPRNYTWNKTPCPQNPVDIKDVKLIHYNLAYRPWRYDDVMYEDIFWKHAKNTKVYDELQEMKAAYGEDKKTYDRTWMQNLVNLAIEHTEVTETVNDKIKNGKLVLIP